MSPDFETRLAIEERSLEVIKHAPKVKEVVMPEVRHVAANDLTRRELAYYLGIKTDESKGKLVAIIPVIGPMSNTWEWRGTNTEWVATQLQIAADNVNVVAIVLSMDTPGGTVNGTEKLAQVVRNSSVPVIAHTDYMCASAGIWVASMAKEHWIASAKTTGLGSVGVISTLFSMKEYNDKQGFDFRVLRSKGSENKALANPYEPINDEAVAEEQKLIDEMRVEMLSQIRSSRPQVPQNIDGKMYYGQDAIRMGLADKVGSLQDAIKRAFYLGFNQNK